MAFSRLTIWRSVPSCVVSNSSFRDFIMASLGPPYESHCLRHSEDGTKGARPRSVLCDCPPLPSHCVHAAVHSRRPFTGKRPDGSERARKIPEVSDRGPREQSGDGFGCLALPESEEVG